MNIVTTPLASKSGWISKDSTSGMYISYDLCGNISFQTNGYINRREAYFIFEKLLEEMEQTLEHPLY